MLMRLRDGLRRWIEALSLCFPQLRDPQVSLVPQRFDTLVSLTLKFTHDMNALLELASSTLLAPCFAVSGGL